MAAAQARNLILEKSLHKFYILSRDKVQIEECHVLMPNIHVSRNLRLALGGEQELGRRWGGDGEEVNGS